MGVFSVFVNGFGNKVHAPRAATMHCYMMNFQHYTRLHMHTDDYDDEDDDDACRHRIEMWLETASDYSVVVCSLPRC